MSLPTWGEYTPSNKNNLPEWDDYSTNESKAQNSALPSWDNYSSKAGNPALINLDSIEQIESAGNNNATSSTGAKGLYQFMPDTSYEYSKRLFGTGTRDASTLSPEKQKEMASAYFKDLLKEFNGNIDEAIAAYNWGQGNVEKDVKAHGSHWLDYAPQETQNYVEKYNRLSSPSHGYDHAEKGGDAHLMPSMSDMEETMSTNFKQIKDLWKGGVAEINKLTGNEYSEKDIDEAKDALNSGEGQSMKTTAAIGASLAAPELVPEIEGLGVAGKGASWLGKGLASSLAYQGVDSGKIDALQTAEDMATGAALEGSLRLVARPAIKQVGKAFTKIIDSSVTSPEAKQAVRDYLATTRAAKVAKMWGGMGEGVTLEDALAEYASNTTDLAESPEALADIKRELEPYRNSLSPYDAADELKEAATELRFAADDAAKRSEAARKLLVLSDANEKAGMFSGFTIPESEMPSTLLQKTGQALDSFAGLKANDLTRAIKRSSNLKSYKPEINALVKDLNNDNRNISTKLKKLEGNTSKAARDERIALTRQRTVNNKMKDYLSSGLEGRKVKVNDLALAVKEAQDEAFKQGLNKNLTRRFKELTDKMLSSNSFRIEQEALKDSPLVQYGLKTGAKAFLAFASRVLGVQPEYIMGAATLAGSAARASRRANLAMAKGLVDAVENGTMTKEEAEKAISSIMNRKAKAAGKLGASLRESFK